MTPTPRSWLGYAKRFNVLAEKVKSHGMYVGYHAHQHDFAPLDGTTGWDIIASNTSKDVIMQLDLGNCMDGHGDPIVYLKRYPGRAVTIHLKEWSATNKKAMIGEGDVKWTEVFDSSMRPVRRSGTSSRKRKTPCRRSRAQEISLANLKKFRT